MPVWFSESFLNNDKLVPAKPPWPLLTHKSVVDITGSSKFPVEWWNTTDNSFNVVARYVYYDWPTSMDIILPFEKKKHFQTIYCF